MTVLAEQVTQEIVRLRSMEVEDLDVVGAARIRLRVKICGKQFKRCVVELEKSTPVAGTDTHTSISLDCKHAVVPVSFDERDKIRVGPA